MIKQELCKITCEVTSELSTSVRNGIIDCGISFYTSQVSRTLVMHEVHPFFLFLPNTKLEEIPSEVFYFYCPREFEENVISHISNMASLHIPGRGNIYGKNIILYTDTAISFDYAKLSSLVKSSRSILSDLSGIHCIIQRGNGNDLGKAILDMGIGVPTIAFGVGGGLREKLGIFRIAVPSAKEIAFLVVSSHDEEMAIKKMSESARLDQPGKGFIYSYKLSKGIINTKFFISKNRHIASVEQIIYAIDDIKGGNQWRTKVEHKKEKNKDFKQSKMFDISIYSNEGSMSSIITRAMANGAGGATKYEVDYVDLTDINKIVSNSREMSNLIISENIFEKIFNSLFEENIFEKSISAFIEVADVSSAFSYIPN